ncbi:MULTISPECIES: SDR family oxidoreductase [unclassified Streptomyces]|uniref:SDR family oxidoreductase n=1 Tax=unclassified Streptomyces TaxID=2593676 RepID=UPI00365D819C
MRTRSLRHPDDAHPLEGRVAVVTGAARGIGASTAHALSRHGAKVALLGLEGERLRRLAAGLPGPAIAWTVDVTDANALAATADAVRDTLGKPSVVVANAGVAIGGPLLDCDPEDWRRVIEVNIVGSALTARCFLPDLLSNHGYYLQVASLTALAPTPFLTAYCASKSGVEAFAHSLRAEISHRGVDVGIAYLNWADTTLIHHADRTKVFQLLRAQMPWPASVNHDPASYADAMVRGIEHRSAHIYAPPWLRAAQTARAVMPALVVHYFRWALAARGDDPLPPTGLLGPGGAAANPRAHATPDHLSHPDPGGQTWPYDTT